MNAYDLAGDYERYLEYREENTMPDFEQMERDLAEQAAQQQHALDMYDFMTRRYPHLLENLEKLFEVEKMRAIETVTNESEVPF